jgi:hypothetical protein
VDAKPKNEDKEHKVREKHRVKTKCEGGTSKEDELTYDT